MPGLASKLKATAPVKKEEKDRTKKGDKKEKKEKEVAATN